MRKFIFYMIIQSFILNVRSNAQVDAHYTQYYANPQWLNPAFTGLIDGSYRVTTNYRKQWPAIASALNSQGLSGDIVLPNNFGLGLTIFNQKTGDGGYQYTSAYLSLSYQVHLAEHQILSSGFQIGFLNRRISSMNFQFGNQFNPTIGYDPTLPSNEIFAYPSATSIDGSFGLLYFDGDPDKSFNPFLGFSMYHPTEPENHFVSNADGNKVAARYSFHGGFRIRLNDRVNLFPNAIYLSQGGVNEIVGAISMNLKIDDNKDFIVGGSYRINDAIAPNIGLHFNRITVGFSYDINTSQIKTGSTNNGGYELSISFTNAKKIPDTKFICPRL
ncbi:MAG: PorP/SprF family type IX secretion system membrane protein [Chitinophagaceae bacterium]|nr:PorP/SprF family type IX secretion system membrane protein [Chitinophagaceae bacterium]